MGAQNSKINTNRKDISTSEAHLPSTPISTPKPKVIDCDPRSPSANIVRTPIQSAVNLNQADTPIIGVLDDQDQVIIDPRSPTVEFTRTPITTGNECPKPRNKNLDLVRQQLTNFSPMKLNGNEITPGKNGNKGPILLGVSPITKKINQEKRKSYIGLLETNLDFVETDLDQVVKPKEKEIDIMEEIELDEPKEKIIKTEIAVEETEEKLAETPIENELNKTPIEKEINKTATEKEINKTPTEKGLNKTTAEKELIISPIKETLEKINQIDKDIKEVIAIANNQNNVIDMDDENSSNAFDKKVTNLIYEDQEIINIPKNIKQQNTGGSRTPLGERNFNHSAKKSVSKLRVHDKPTLNKNEFAVSKIPVFKEKKGKSKMTQQCENTPPRQLNEIKHRKTQWDADKTLII